MIVPRATNFVSTKPHIWIFDNNGGPLLLIISGGKNNTTLFFLHCSHEGCPSSGTRKLELQFTFYSEGTYLILIKSRILFRNGAFKTDYDLPLRNRDTDQEWL